MRILSICFASLLAACSSSIEALSDAGGPLPSNDSGAIASDAATSPDSGGADASDASAPPPGDGGVTPISCSLGPSSPKGTLIHCTMQHQELQGGVVTRVFGVFIPTNYVAWKSGMILKIQGTTHKISSDCANAPAVSEDAGWLPFLQTVPSPAPVMVCPEGWFDTGGTDNGERFNVWGYHKWNYVNGVQPDDVDFLVRVVRTVQQALALDPKFMAVTNDWYPLGSIMANELAALHPELVSAVVLYNDATFTRVSGSVSGGLLDDDGTSIAPPLGPVHYLSLASILSSPATTMCGTASNRTLTIDDIVAFWSLADQPTSTSYGDPTGQNKKFCTGQYSSSGAGTATTLEKLDATSTTTGKEIAVYKLVGNARGTPWCSFNYQGKPDPTICDPSDPPHDFSVPAATCAYTSPCNHYLAAPNNDILGILYNFMVSHTM